MLSIRAVRLTWLAIREKLRIHEVLIADHLLQNFSLAIDQVSFGNLKGAVAGADVRIRIARGGKRDLELLFETIVEILVAIDADAQHHHTLGLIGLRESFERWRLGNARTAPTGPEIEHQNLTAEILAREGFAVVGGDFEIRSGVAGIGDLGFKRGRNHPNQADRQHQDRNQNQAVDAFTHAIILAGLCNG
jgi:hypothetical protein